MSDGADPRSSPEDSRGRSTCAAGLHRLSRGLVAYGVIGLVVAALAFGALVWVERPDRRPADRVEDDGRPLATTPTDTATALRDASTTAQTFSDTLDRTATPLPRVSDRIISLQADLDSLEASLRVGQHPGRVPLGGAADCRRRRSPAQPRWHRLAADRIVDAALEPTATPWPTNASSLGRSRDSTQALATRLGSGVVEDSLARCPARHRRSSLLVFTALSLVPAVGALVFGCGCGASSRPDGRRPLAVRSAQLVPERRPRREHPAHAVDAAAGRRRRRAQVQPGADVIRVEAGHGRKMSWRMSWIPPLMSPPT